MPDRKYSRKQIRLKQFDYSSNGAYFITICVKNRIEVFGKIKKNRCILNSIGDIAQKYIMEIPLHHENVEIFEYIVMPNHVHLILLIKDDASNIRKVSVCEIVKGYKQAVSKEIHYKDPHVEFIWQRSFYDHIIRDYESLEKIQEYIKYNPFQNMDKM